MLQLKAMERVWSDGTQPVVAEVKPAKSDEVGKRADFEDLEATLAEVEMFELDKRRQVDSSHYRRLERVAVEVELEAVDRDAGRDGGQTAARAVDDTAGRVAEAESRAAETVAGRQRCDDDRLDEPRGNNQQTGTQRR